MNPVGCVQAPVDVVPLRTPSSETCALGWSHWVRLQDLNANHLFCLFSGRNTKPLRTPSLETCALGWSHWVRLQDLNANHLFCLFSGRNTNQAVPITQTHGFTLFGLCFVYDCQVHDAQPNKEAERCPAVVSHRYFFCKSSQSF